MSTSPTKTSRWARLTRSQRESVNGWVLTTPSLFAILFVVVIPFLAVVVFAFANIRLIDIPHISLDNIDWTFANIQRALNSTTFWSALNTTIIYAAATTVGAIVCGMTMALALRRPFWGRGFVRAAFLIPYVLPVIAATTIWRTMLNQQYGFVNAFGMQYLGWERPIAFLNTATMDIWGLPVPLTLMVVILFEIWKTAPLAFLFVMARLQSIPRDIEEAAAIDGANSRQILFRIIMPQLRAVVLLLVLLRFIWSFQSFNDIYLLTGGAGGTQVMAVRVYHELITRADIGSASAYGLLMTVILTVLLLAYVIVSRRKEEI